MSAFNVPMYFWPWVLVSATVILTASTYGLGKSPSEASPEYKTATAFTIVGVVAFLFSLDRVVLDASDGALSLYKMMIPL